MRKRTLAVFILVMMQASLMFAQLSDHKPVGFYFDGKEFHLGMSEREAIAELTDCCRLSPPPSTDSSASAPGQLKGYYVLAKEGSSQSVLGGIWFKNQKVISLSRELADKVDTSDGELVAFMRAFQRSLPEGETMTVLQVQHEKASNGESDVLSLEFPGGRRVEISIVTLDKAEGSKRDFVDLNEILGSTD